MKLCTMRHAQPAAPPVVPFRWDVSRHEQLGRLARGRPADSYPEFLDDLRACAAGVVKAAAHLAAGCGLPDLLFVGRSPESVFDYLRGVCWGTSWFDRLRPFHVSIRATAPAELRRDFAPGLAAFRAYLATLEVDPASLRTRGGPAVLVDLVASGATFESLVALLRANCRERGVCWHVARQKLRLVGLTERETKSPRGHRWHLHGQGIDHLARGTARSVPVHPRFWDYIGNRQPKVAETYPPADWGSERLRQPARSADHAPALRLAVHLFETGRNRDERVKFLSELARARGLRLASLRALASQLRRAPIPA